MARHPSVWILLALIAAIGVLFFQVIQPFMVAIFVSIVLAVLAAPIHDWLTKRIGGHQRIAAALTTAVVLLLGLLPIGAVLLMAGTQVMEVGKDAITWMDERSSQNFEETLEDIQQTKIGGTLQELYTRLPIGQRENAQQATSRVVEGATKAFYERTRGFLSDTFTSLVNFAIITLSLYYFLADRQLFVREFHRLVPLHDGEEEKLESRFQTVCRGVVLGTLFAGLVQAILAGIAFVVLGIPQVWMLIVLTLFFSFIPFLGSAVVWGSITVMLIFNGNYGSAIALAIYGVAIISTADNLVRAHVIGTQAKLHPLIALVTVLGALQFIGLWGIFVGPMIAALLYSLVDILRSRLAA